MMVASRPSAGEVPDMTAGEHFERVAVVYESLRTTDEAPVRAGGQLFIYTRTPQQNARTIWGRYFPRFHRARAAPAQPGRDPGRRPADRRAHDDRHTDLPAPAYQHGRAARGPGSGAPLLDILLLH